MENEEKFSTAELTHILVKQDGLYVVADMPMQYQKDFDQCIEKYNKALQAAKDLSIKVKNEDATKVYLYYFGVIDIIRFRVNGEIEQGIYTLPGYKFEIECCDKGFSPHCEKGFCIHKLAIVSPIRSVTAWFSMMHSCILG